MARKLLPEPPFERLAGEVFLALLAGGEAVRQDAIDSSVLVAAIAAGIADAHTGAPPALADAGWAVRETWNLCQALGLLTSSGDWQHRQLALTEVGQATALAALHYIATARS